MKNKLIYLGVLLILSSTVMATCYYKVQDNIYGVQDMEISYESKWNKCPPILKLFYTNYEIEYVPPPSGGGISSGGGGYREPESDIELIDEPKVEEWNPISLIPMIAIICFMLFVFLYIRKKKKINR